MTDLWVVALALALMGDEQMYLRNQILIHVHDHIWRDKGWPLELRVEVCRWILNLRMRHDWRDRKEKDEEKKRTEGTTRAGDAGSAGIPGDAGGTGPAAGKGRTRLTTGAEGVTPGDANVVEDAVPGPSKSEGR